jgi:hypothetical protein
MGYKLEGPQRGKVLIEFNDMSCVLIPRDFETIGFEAEKIMSCVDSGDLVELVQSIIRGIHST